MSCITSYKFDIHFLS